MQGRKVEGKDKADPLREKSMAFAVRIVKLNHWLRDENDRRKALKIMRVGRPFLLSSPFVLRSLSFVLRTSYFVLAAMAAALSAKAGSAAAWRQADFAASLYRTTLSSAAADDNIVLSPWGVANLFALLQTGARGDTAKGMAFALQLGGVETPAPDAVAKTFKEARTNLTRAANDSVTLELSDSLWLAPNFNVNPKFAALTGDAFEAEVRTTEMGATGRKAINAFVEDKTHGRIKNLIAPPILDDPLTRLVAVDTVYLKAMWQNPFEKDSTYDQVFHAPGGDVKVPFLHAKRQAQILDATECAALNIPYRYHSMEMLVILPSPSNSLAEIEAKISGPWLDRLATSLWRGETKIALPRFDFGSEHDLSKALVPMGMGAAFDPDRADFSGIAPKLCIDTAIQKANVTVDEEGTEASAATFVSMRCTAIPPGNRPPPRPFVADRPFLFIIRETRTGLILFLGRVTKP